MWLAPVRTGRLRCIRSSSLLCEWGAEGVAWLAFGRGAHPAALIIGAKRHASAATSTAVRRDTLRCSRTRAMVLSRPASAISIHASGTTAPVPSRTLPLILPVVCASAITGSRGTPTTVPMLRASESVLDEIEILTVFLSSGEEPSGMSMMLLAKSSRAFCPR